MTTIMTTTKLFDYRTNAVLGDATAEQIEASDNAGETGAITIDVRTGEVLIPGTWAASDATSNGFALAVYAY